ncbi:hypothetical protein GCM10029963_34630 [Micromonospora andamanensis]
MDDHPAAAVLAGRDVTGEVEILHRVVLGVHGEVVASRIARQPARHRPGDEHPVALQPQVPVQAAGVVLLDDEPGAVVGPGPSGSPGRHRFGGTRGVPLTPVLLQPVSHIPHSPANRADAPGGGWTRLIPGMPSVNGVERSV